MNVGNNSNECKEKKKTEVKKYQRELVILENGEKGRNCSKCGELKSVNEFHKDNRRKIGYISKCKECIRLERGITKRYHKSPDILEKGFNGKYCPSCRKEKKSDDFYNDKRAKDGKKSWCKECCNVPKKGERVSKYPLIKENGIEGKVCNKCETFTPKEDLVQNQNLPDGYQSICRECNNGEKNKWRNKNKEKFATTLKRSYQKNKDKIAINKKEYYRKNKEKIVNYSKIWYENNKERQIQLMMLYGKKRRTLQRKLKFEFTINDENELRDYYKNSCALTGETKAIDIDHFIPVAWGHGGTYRGNLLLLDSKLNRSKQDKILSNG